MHATRKQAQMLECVFKIVNAVHGYSTKDVNICVASLKPPKWLAVQGTGVILPSAPAEDSHQTQQGDAAFSFHGNPS